MNVGSSVRQGLSITRRSGSAVAILFLANLAIAALAGYPIYRGIQGFTGHSLMSQELARGFSVDWLTDFAFNAPGSFNRYARLIVWLGCVSLALNSILAGGVLTRFKAPEMKYSLGDFFRDTGRYAWRLLRLLVIGLICYWIVFKLLNEKLGQWVDHWTDNWADDRAVFGARLALALLLVLGLGFVNLVMDYARVRLVLEEGTGAVQAFLASLGFSLGRLKAVIGVYIVPSSLGLALLGVYRLLFPWEFINVTTASASPGRVFLALAGLFVVQQLVMFGRYWFRVATWASEWCYYSSARAGAGGLGARGNCDQ
jgi:hypothetical protein